MQLVVRVDVDNKNRNITDKINESFLHIPFNKRGVQLPFKYR